MALGNIPPTHFPVHIQLVDQHQGLIQGGVDGVASHTPLIHPSTNTKKIQSICGVSAMSGRGKAGYVCTLRRDGTVGQLMTYVNIHTYRVTIDLASTGSLHSPQLGLDL